MNSGNSHKPLSSDGYRKKRVQPALPKRGKRALGRQAGLKGKTLRQVEKPNKVQVHLPEHCAVCGREVAADELHQIMSKRQVFDLPEPKLVVTEHHLGQIECCGQAQATVATAHAIARVKMTCKAMYKATPFRKPVEMKAAPFMPDQLM